MRFIKWATRPSSVCRETPIVFFMTKNGLKKFYSIPIDKEKSDYYVEEESYKKLLKKVLEEVSKDIEKHINQYPKFYDNLVEKGKSVYNNLKSEPEKLWKAYKEYSDFVTEFSIYFISTFSGEEYIVPKLEKLFPNDIRMISSPGKLLAHQKMRIALLKKIQKKFKKNTAGLIFIII